MRELGDEVGARRSDQIASTPRESSMCAMWLGTEASRGPSPRLAGESLKVAGVTN